MIIACLHTADSNIPLFDAAAVGTSAQLIHQVRTDLLAAAEQAGGLTDAIADATEQALRALATQADAVLLTCSTLGPVVARFPATDRILRTDAALAEAAMATSGSVTVLCAAPTTLAATSALFMEAAQGHAVRLDIRLVPNAWALFKAGQQDAYWQLIAQAADDAYAEGTDKVVLAQASMAGAAHLVTRGPKPLAAPSEAINSTIELIRASNNKNSFLEIPPIFFQLYSKRKQLPYK